jgi:hypothetical protein
MACNLQTGKNKINMLTEYENVTQKVLLSIRINTADCRTTSTCAPFLAHKI